MKSQERSVLANQLISQLDNDSLPFIFGGGVLVACYKFICKISSFCLSREDIQDGKSLLLSPFLDCWSLCFHSESIFLTATRVIFINLNQASCNFRSFNPMLYRFLRETFLDHLIQNSPHYCLLTTSCYSPSTAQTLSIILLYFLHSIYFQLAFVVFNIYFVMGVCIHTHIYILHPFVYCLSFLGDSGREGILSNSGSPVPKMV